MKKNLQQFKDFIKQNNIVVLDVDDTLLHSNSKIIVTEPGQDPIKYSTAEWTLARTNVSRLAKVDYEDFRDDDKIYSGIRYAEPIIPNLKLIDYAVDNNYEIAILTARGNKNAVLKALNDKIKTRPRGATELKPFHFKDENVIAVGDSKSDRSTQQLKADRLKEFCNRYNRVYFIEDDENNLLSARLLNLPNLTLIDAKQLERSGKTQQIASINNDGTIIYGE